MIGAASAATMVFYNQVLGVSPALCGIAFAIGSIIDAVSDPIVAAWSDNFRSRWGRRHPFMAFSALPLTLGFYLMYAPPSDLTEAQYFAWLIFTIVLIRVGKTFYSVPHAALGAELTDDYNERTSIFGYNTLVGAVGGLVLFVAMIFVYFPSTEGYVNGFTNPNGYPVLALTGGLWIVLTTFLCVYGTRDQIPNLHDVHHQRVSIFDNWKDLKSLLQSKSYLSVCIAWLVMTTSGGILAVVGTYTFLYGYEMSTEDYMYIRYAYIPGMILCLPAAAWLTGLLDKKWTVISTSIFCAFMVGLPHTLQLFGLFPANDSVWMLPTLIGMMTVGLAFLLVVPVVIDSQLGDVADEHDTPGGELPLYEGTNSLQNEYGLFYRLPRLLLEILEVELGQGAAGPATCHVAVRRVRRPRHEGTGQATCRCPSRRRRGNPHRDRGPPGGAPDRYVRRNLPAGRPAAPAWASLSGS